MTDRVNAFIVVLDRDYREDDVEATLQAIGQIKGVVHIQPNVADVGTIVLETRIKNDIRNRLHEMIREI